MTQVVCKTCQRYMVPKKNGVFVEETAGSQREPYKIWAADAFECLGCGAEIITAFGRVAISEHFCRDYKRWAAEVYCKAHEARLKPEETPQPPIRNRDRLIEVLHSVNVNAVGFAQSDCCAHVARALEGYVLTDGQRQRIYDRMRSDDTGPHIRELLDQGLAHLEASA